VAPISWLDRAAHVGLQQEGDSTVGVAGGRRVGALSWRPPHRVSPARFDTSMQGSPHRL